MKRTPPAVLAAAAAIALLIGAPAPATAAPPPDIPQVAPATPGELLECESLIGFEYEATRITAAAFAPAGAQPAHCRVTGQTNERVGEDGQRYAIGWEMRLPADWAGRYLYQGNGGIDGSVAPALGNFTGGQERSGLAMGFAIISSDAGHTGAQNGSFGNDGQARLDFGYNTAVTLTPLAKALIEAAYGRGPDTSYFAGGSNGGRHTMVAATRLADEYDGFLPVAPGFNLPQAAVAQIAEAQLFNTVATVPGNLNTAITPAERAVIKAGILERCDGIDRLRDGLVQDSERCAKFFDIHRDVPTCEGERDGTCLSVAQKDVLAQVYAGVTTSTGEEIYESFPVDAGIMNGDWATWNLFISVALDPLAVGTVFMPYPDYSILASPLTADVDAMEAGIYEAGLSGQSAMEFMTPLGDDTDYDTLRDTGAKMIVIHGASDAVFSADDTARWFTEVDKAYGNKAEDFIRYFQVPGMAHVSGGASTDKVDALGALIDWVENGVAPDRLIAEARANNAEAMAAGLAPGAERPLCVYPLVARYEGGDPDSADSFACKASSGDPASAD
ncbi:tannase/feruloyl esterase family alpha/beta hydrolase [Microbacterium lacusdiani]